MTTTFIIINLLLALTAIAAVYGLVHLAHHLPDRAPADDASWGTDLSLVPSDPLPLHQLADRENERQHARAA